jgi:putative transposase
VISVAFERPLPVKADVQIWILKIRYANGIKISMDGKGRWMDNVFIERLWRSLKYECVYLNAFDDLKDAKAKLNTWIEYYNHERPHSSLNDQTPNEFYEGIEPLSLAA